MRFPPWCHFFFLFLFFPTRLSALNATLIRWELRPLRTTRKWTSWGDDDDDDDEDERVGGRQAGGRVAVQGGESTNRQRQLSALRGLWLCTLKITNKFNFWSYRRVKLRVASFRRSGSGYSLSFVTLVCGICSGRWAWLQATHTLASFLAQKSLCVIVRHLFFCFLKRVLLSSTEGFVQQQVKMSDANQPRVELFVKVSGWMKEKKKRRREKKSITPRKWRWRGDIMWQEFI